MAQPWRRQEEKTRGGSKEVEETVAQKDGVRQGRKKRTKKIQNAALRANASYSGGCAAVRVARL